MKKLVFTIVLFFIVCSPIFAATLKPDNVDQFFVEPGIGSNFEFIVEGEVPADFKLEFRILDAEGQPVEGKKLNVDYANRGVRICDLVLPQGFWELECGEQQFGVVSQPKFEGDRDKFFAIDGALSWLVKDDKLRESLVRSARRSGIGMIRERVTWGAIEKENGKFDWETDRRYEKLRNYGKSCGVEILEVFHDAPLWTGKIEKYPGDLIKTATSWDAISKRWHSTWGGLEIWNEPEISFGAELPADQYVPMARAIAYRLKKSDVATPIFGGSMSHFHTNWLRCAAENGLLADMDGFSFHTYARTPEVEAIFVRYRDWLTENGYESMPLWLTECGRPWKRGTLRPTAEQDMASAVDITMKGVEARCCGIDRYFPFVYPYYDENDNNFGMMDKLGTPCRSMAAYVQMIRLLSGAEYVGDLKTDQSKIFRSRVFRTKTDETLAVLYTGTLKEPETWKLPVKIKRIESAVGLPVQDSNENEILLTSNNMYYVWIEKPTTEFLNENTEAMRLCRSARKLQALKSEIPPVVLRFQYDKKKFTATPDGYLIDVNVDDSLPLTVRVFNLDDRDAGEFSYKIGGAFGKKSLAKQEFVIRGQSFVDLTWNVSLEDSDLETGNAQEFRVVLEDGKSRPLFAMFHGKATWSGIQKSLKVLNELPVGNLSFWNKNIAGIGQMTMETPNADGVLWRMNATFKEGDRWVYPRFKLPKETDLTRYDGIVLWARCLGDATPRFFLFENNGAGYIIGPVFKSTNKTDAETDVGWHVVKIPFEKLQHASATRSDPNGKLDLDQVDFISLGANSRTPECTLEIKKIAFYKE